MRRLSNLVVLCEDEAQLNFALGLCDAFGYPTGRVRTISLPPGDAKQRVREILAEQIRLVRSARSESLLIVGVDCDELAPRERLRFTFGRQLERNAQSDRVVVFTPEREIEHWIAHLIGNTAPPNLSQGPKAKLTSRAFLAGRSLGQRCRGHEGIDLPGLEAGGRDCKRLIEGLRRR